MIDVKPTMTDSDVMDFVALNKKSFVFKMCLMQGNLELFWQGACPCALWYISS